MLEASIPRRRRLRLGATLRISLGVWTCFALACTASAYWAMRTHGHSPLRLALYNVVVWWGWAAATPVVARLGRWMPLLPFSWRATAAHGAAALVFGLLHQVWWTVLQVVLRPYDAMGVRDLATGLGADVRDRMFLEVVLYVAVLGVTYAVDYQRRLHDRELRAAQLEASLAQARLAALELQLQPHFLFNTLHAIGGLVRQARGPDAIEMIAGLSDLLRYSLDHAGRQLVPLDHELAMVGRYLEIQRLRFSDRLTVTLELAPGVGRARVPALVLQPLVENAVRYGVECTTGAGEIAIRARRDRDALVLAVSNTAVAPLPADAASASGVGIANTRARLAQLFPGRHAFALRSEDGAVTATVTLPWDVAPG